jgi:hypothetical protein
MPQSLTNFDNALKDTYGPGLKNALNNSNPALTEITQKPEGEDVIGRQAVWSIHSGRSTATGSAAELGTLPTADRQRFIQPKQDLAYLYHTIKVSGQAKHLTKGDEAAFARALETEIEGAEDDVKHDLARQIQGGVVSIGGTDYTGSLGLISGVSSETITMATNTTPQMRVFFVNETVAIINGSTGASRGTGTIASIDRSAKTITLSAAVTGMATGDYVARPNSFGNDIYGLAALISDTVDFAGVDVSASGNEVFKALTAGSSTTAISEVVLDEAGEVVETDGDGSTPELWFMDHLQRRKLASQLQAQKRYDGREMTLKAGWKGLQIAQGTAIADRFQPTTKVYGLSPKKLAWFNGLDWTWDEDDGKVLYKALDGTDAVEARYKAYKQFVALVRNAHVVLTLAEPTF